MKADLTTAPESVFEANVNNMDTTPFERDCSTAALELERRADTFQAILASTMNLIHRNPFLLKKHSV